ncbi:hypothetical protein [Thermomonospora umbrina]|nr:hypothetical protein [Thermomonospora umbrina]
MGVCDGGGGVGEEEAIAAEFVGEGVVVVGVDSGRQDGDAALA